MSASSFILLLTLGVLITLLVMAIKLWADADFRQLTHERDVYALACAMARDERDALQKQVAEQSQTIARLHLALAQESANVIQLSHAAQQQAQLGGNVLRRFSWN